MIGEFFSEFWFNTNLRIFGDFYIRYRCGVRLVAFLCAYSREPLQ